MSIPSATESIGRLRGEGTTFVFIVNGIPWWFPHDAQTTRALPDLDYLDPGARLAKAVGMEPAFGSIVYSGNEMVEPGLIVNHSGGNNVVSVGDPGLAGKARVEAVSRLLEAAGFKSPIAPDIRQAVWTKLLTSNLASFPICTLLGAPQ